MSYKVMIKKKEEEYIVNNENYAIKAHIPTEEELEPYKNSDKEPSEWIQELMEGKSKEEMLLADDNWNKYVDLVLRISGRLAGEETEKEIAIEREKIRKSVEDEMKRHEEKKKQIQNTVDKNLWKQGELF